MQNIKHIISDLDGVFYKYDEHFNVRAFKTYADAAVKFIPGMGFDTAMQMIVEGRRYSHVAHKVFLDTYEVDEEEMLHFFQENMDISYMKPDVSVIEKMRQADVKHSMLTASNDFWAMLLVNQLALQEFYSEKNIFTREKCNKQSKSKSTEPYRIALSTMGFQAEESLMLEDTQQNLKYAKEAGLITVLTRPKANEPIESYTDYVFEEPEHFWDYLNKQPRP